MNILILANDSEGFYLFRRELAAKLLESHSLCVVLPDTGYCAELEQIGCRLIRMPMDRRGENPVRDVKLLFAYLGLLRREKPRLVLTYTIKPNIYGGLVCRWRRVPYAANVTGLGTAFQKPGLLRRLVTRLYRMALKKARVVFFENAGNLETFVHLRILPQETCRLLPGAGVCLERFAPAEYPDQAAPVRFLFIGRIMREKGIGELFTAMKRLREAGVDCTLEVLGYYEEDFAGEIRRYEEAGWLRYWGHRPDVRPFIAGCHCFVLPSYHEGMANTLLECGAMARPLITSRIHGCMEAVQEGKTGFLCEPGNADALYEAMKAFSDLPYEAKREMGLASHRHIAAVFEKGAVVEQTMQALGLRK